MTALVPDRLHNIQSLRGVAAMLVVFSHLLVIERKYSQDHIIPDWFYLGISGVDLFFVISGFIMVYITWNKPASGRYSAEFLFSRFSRIYPLYWFVALMVFIAWKIEPGIMNYDTERGSLIKSFLLWPHEAYPMLDVAWTLSYELYFYFIFALILLLAPRWRALALTGWIIFAIVGNLAGADNISPETIMIFSPLCLEFFMGAIAAGLYFRFRNWSGLLISSLGLSIAIAMAILMIVSGFYEEFGELWVRVSAAGIPAAIIVLGFSISDRAHLRWLPRLERLGDWSYSIYLTHVLTLSACGLIWRSFAVPGYWDNILVCALMVILSVFVGYLTWRFVEQPLLNLTRSWRRKIFGS